MATMVLAGAGAAVGGMIGGPVGAQIGWVAGSMIGNALFSTKTDDLIMGPRVTDLSVTASSYGVARPRIWGTVIVGGNCIWSTSLVENIEVDRQDVGGKGGGGGGTTTTVGFSYTVSFAIGCGEGPSLIRKIWFNADLIYDGTDDNSGMVKNLGITLRMYKGDEDQLPDPLMELHLGVGEVPAYRGECYFVIENLDLTPYGNIRPNVRAEVVRQGAAAVVDTRVETTRNLQRVTFDYNESVAYADYAVEDIVIRYNLDTNLEEWRLDKEAISATTSSTYGPAIVDPSTGYLFWWVWPDNGGTEIIQVDPYNGEIVSRSGYLDFVPLMSMKIQGTWLMAHSWTGLGGVRAAKLWDIRTLFEKSGDPELLTNTYYHPDAVFTGSVSLTSPLLSQAFTHRPMDSAISTEGNYWFILESAYGPDAATTGWVHRIKVSDGSMETKDVYTDLGLSELSDIVWSGYFESIIISARGLDELGANDSWRLYRLAWTDFSDHATLHIAAWGPYNYAASFGDGFFLTNPLGTTAWFQPSSTNGLVQWQKYRLDTLETIQEVTAIEAPLTNVVSNGSYDDVSNAIWTSNSGGTTKVSLDKVQAPGVGLDWIVEDICKNAGLVPEQLDVTPLAVVTVFGYIITRPQTHRGQIETLMKAYFFDRVESDAKLKWPMRGQASVATIPEDSLVVPRGSGTNQSKPQAQISRVDDLTLPNEVEVTFLHPDREGEPSTQGFRRHSRVSRGIMKYEFTIAMLDSEAIRIADKHLARAWRERHPFKFIIPQSYSRLDPADVIVVQRNGIATEVRILHVRWGAPGMMEIEAINQDATSYESEAVGYTQAFSPATLEYVPVTTFVLLDAPLLRAADDDPGYYAAFYPTASAETWPGGTLYSRDALNTESLYEAATGYSRAVSAAGNVDALILPPDRHSVWDHDNTITVRLRSGTLNTGLRRQVLDGANALFFYTTGELLQFMEVTDNGDGTFDLDKLLRGRLGTEWAMDRHSAGEPFVTLDTGGLYRIAGDLEDIGLPQDYLAITAGRNASVTHTRTATNTGVAMKPYSPVHPRSTWNSGDSSATLTWVRRARANHEWLDSIDVPLDEPYEQYEVDVLGSDDLTDIISTNVVNSPEWNYSSAQQIADVGDLQDGGFYYAVYQMSSRVGRGYPLTNVTNFDLPIATDFSSASTGEGMPTGWTAQLLAASQPENVTWSIIDTHATFPLESGKALRIVNLSGRFMASWDKVGQVTDVDLLTLAWFNFYIAGSAVEGIVYARANTTSDFLAVGIQQNGTGVIVVNGSVVASTAGVVTAANVDVKMWTRFSVQGTQLRARWWADGGAEPGTWDLEHTLSGGDPLGDGYVGWGSYYHMHSGDYLDIFAAAFNGNSAVNPY